MASNRISVLASLATLGATFSLSAQQPAPSARLVRVEGRVTLNGQPVSPDAPATTLGNIADLQTMEGRALVALKRAGVMALSANSSARIHANAIYNFNRLDILSGSAIVLNASNWAKVNCGTEASLSSDGVCRFDVLEPERVDGSQRCRVRVYEGAASTPSASTLTYVLRSGQEMVMNVRAGDMIPIVRLAPGPLDEFDRWAREQAGAAR